MTKMRLSRRFALAKLSVVAVLTAALLTSFRVRWPKRRLTSQLRSDCLVPTQVYSAPMGQSS